MENFCILHKFDGGLMILHDAEEDAVNWLNYVHGDYSTREMRSKADENHFSLPHDTINGK